MGSKTTKTKSQETATTQPNVPGYASAPVNNYYQDVGEFQKLDPYSMWTPANDIQNQAFTLAGSLSHGGRAYDAAAGTFGRVMNGSTPQAGYQGAGLAGLPSARQAEMGLLGDAVPMRGANAGNARNVNLGGYNPGRLGDANGYDAAQAGGVNLGGIERAQAASLLDGFERYQNPATDAVVNTTLRGFDENAGRTRAAQMAQGARGGAFGGSRFGIAQAETERGLSQDRAATEAGLRSQAFDRSASLAFSDAGLRQQAGLANAAAQNARDTDRAAMQTANRQFNTGQTNAAQAQLAGARNQFGLSQFGAENDASRFGADAANQGQLANAAAGNQFALTNAGFEQQANAANAQTANQFGLARFDAQNDANRFNADAGNQFSLAGFAAGNRNQEFNAGQFNDNQQFNSQQELANRAQQMGAATGMVSAAGQYNDQERANLGAMLDAGAQQRGIDSAYNMIPLSNLLQEQGLMNPELLRILTGQTINGSGTSTTKQSGGLLGTLAGIAAMGANFIPGVGPAVSAGLHAVSNGIR